MSVQEVIDLTADSPVQLTIDTNPSTNSPRDNSQKVRKKKRSSHSKPSSTGTPEVPASLSDSNERSTKLEHSTKRRRTHEVSGSDERRNHKHDPRQQDKSDSADLFFVDLSPAVIPSIPVSQETVLTTSVENESVENEKVGKLLLPSHVTVFGNALVEIISQPLSDSDDDEFIKYLDYEDTKVFIKYKLLYFREFI